MDSNKNKLDTTSRLLSSFGNIEKLHPHKMMTYLAITGSIFVLVFLLISLTIEFSRHPELLADIGVPKFFIIASLIILMMGYVSSGINNAFALEDIEKIRKKIFAIFIIGSVFLIFQFIGWLELVFQGMTFKNDVVGTYVFLITGYHMTQVLVGLGVITVQLYKTRDIFLDPVSKLIYFTAPYEKIKLDIILIYWRYLTISWIFLFIWLVFLF